MDLLEIENDGQEILATNFFETSLATRGGCYLSANAGAFRLLVPPGQEELIDEIKTAREAIISRGPWPRMGQTEAMEILFEDDTDSPFSLQLGAPQVERFPLPEDEGREFVLTIWTAGPKKQITLPAYYRRVDNIPCLKKR
jgi:hypothetical protein